MKILIGGEDRTADRGKVVDTAASKLVDHPDAPAELEPFHSTLILRDANSQSEYTKLLLDLLVLKSGGSADDFYIQRRPGLVGKVSVVWKKILWKLLRYQRERAAFQQNSVNMQLTVALQFMHEEYSREIAELRAQLAKLQECT